MKVATRFGAGLVLVLALLLAAMIYGVSVVNRLADLNNDLAGTDLRATTLSLEQGRLLSQLDEFMRKLAVTHDPEYGERLEELRADFDSSLAELRALDLSDEVREQSERLAEYWRELPLSAMTSSLHSSELGDESERLLLDAFGESSQRLRRSSDAVTAGTQAAVRRRAMEAVSESRRARTLIWILAAVALAASVSVLWWVASSIRRPLRRLAAGTRSVAEGEFSVRVETGERDEFAALSTSFNEMVRRLGERDEEKREFVSKLSHDLKTPLVAMAETTRLLLEEIPGPLAEDQKRLLALNLEASKRLSGMISKLLEMARMEAQRVRYELEDEDLVEVARQVAAAFSARAHECGLTLEVQDPGRPVIVPCDRERLLQAVSNLVENAIKFAPRETGITVRVRALDDPGAGDDGRPAAVIEVADSGPGVPDDEKERIFDKYHQVDGVGRSGQGIGLGLAICREIAEAHRGRIQVDDNPGGGSVFSLRLPAETRQASTAPSP